MILENAYYSLSLVMLILVLGAYIYYSNRLITDTALKLKKIIFAVLPFIIWLLYIKLISGSALLLNLDLPPKFAFLIVIPLILLFVTFYKTQHKNHILTSIPAQLAILLQSFRIFVEFILLYTFYRDIIPITSTFKGLNFDIIIGITAPFIAFLIYKNLNKFRKLAYYWNIFGIILILFVAIIIGSSIYAPSIWGSNEMLVSMEFLSLPYFLIPGFLAPLGIFLHLVSLLQLKTNKA